MTNYGLKPLTSLSSLASQEAREQRRKQLEAVRERRKTIYRNFFKKQRSSATLIES
jgi:hypothetical protein